jgi:natural product biosynthesis luciferase-like monooxygenase protein/amino acid adenylation domain-containing protein
VTRIVDIFGLAPLQQSMLLRAALDPDSSAFVEQLTLQLGELDPLALRRAWSSLCERHELLRASFHWRGLSQPQQAIHAAVELDWEILDWRPGTPAAPADPGVTLRELRTAQRELGFTLDRPPLFRLRLVRLGLSSWTLVWTFHHLILDGWSLGLILDEIRRLYAAAHDGGSAGLEPAPRFRPYIAWLAAREPGRLRDYWATALAGLEPTAAPWSTGDGPGGERRVWLSSSESQQLESGARQAGATLATLVHGAWALLQHQLLGCARVCIGSLCSGRPAQLVDVERIVGMFVNVVPVVVEFDTSEPLARWLGRLQRQLHEHREHGDWPLAEMLRAAQVDGIPYASVVAVENYPLGRAAQPGALAVLDIEVEEQADVPLVLAVVPGDRIELRLAAPPGGHATADLDAMLAALRRICLAIAAAPDLECHALSAQLERARQQQLRQRLGARAPAQYGAEPTLIATCDRIARAQPNHVAIATGDDAWTYAQLRETWERLAGSIVDAPAGPIAVLGHTTPETLAAILAVLRAGRCFVPIDPRQPERRIRERLDHAEVTLVLVGAGVSLEDPRAVLIAELANTAARLPAMPDDPEALAYLLYTSGSSGQPKGVCQSQGHALSFARMFAGGIGLGPSDRLGMVASHAFDAGLMDLFGSLVAGATLCPIAILDHGVTELWSTTLTRLTILHVTPTVFRHLFHAGEARLELRVLVLGGEEVVSDDVARLRRSAAAETVMINGFGPSESTLACQHLIDLCDPIPKHVPIGGPVPGMSVVLVDPDGRTVVAPLSRGEIVIVGEAVACGYHRAPDLSAQRFGTVDGRRCYRSGDLGMRLPTGALVFLGRDDDQIKLGGVRASLGEIRSALLSLANVEGCELLVDPQGRLRAWVVGRGWTSVLLRAALRQQLPEAMIPARIDVLDGLPRLANGKIDRARLWQETGEREPSGVSMPTDDAVFGAILAVFAEVLGVEQFDVQTSAFELGANSLDALRIAGRLEARLSRPVSVKLLFEHSSAAGLAKILSERSTPAELSIERGPIRSPRRWSELQLEGDRVRRLRRTRSSAGPSLSLFFFSASTEDPIGSYRTLLEVAKLADARGFEAVWTPERHFDNFGGIYPEPALIAAALAPVTSRIRLRAGSVVLPLHDPLRVAERWALVDQLSNGRVDLALASGWHRRDFVLAPDRYEDRHAAVLDGIEILERLWRGEPVERVGVSGEPIELRVYPLPLQRDIELWLTCQSPGSFATASARGLNVLTNLNYKSPSELRERLGLFRRGSEDTGRATVMVHTLVGRNDAAIRATASEAYRRYALDNLSLQRAHADEVDRELPIHEADGESVARSAAQRLLDGPALIGDLDRCRARLTELAELGVDEVACLVDFGVGGDQLLEGVAELANLCPAPTARAERGFRAALVSALPLQVQLFVLDRLDAGTGVWNIPTVAWIDGELDRQAVERSLAVLIDRHEALRTGLVEHDGEVMQLILHTATLGLEWLSLRGAEEPEREALTLVRARAEHAFDLRRPPLARAVVVELDPRRFLVALIIHHAVCDGSSTATLGRELLALLDAERVNPALLGPRPLQPADCALWLAQRARASSVFEDQRAWWIAQLEQRPTKLFAAGPSGAQQMLRRTLARDRLQRLTRAALEAGATVFECVAVALILALMRSFARDDLVLGIHHANRPHPDMEPVVGPFVNLLPFRARLVGTERVSEARARLLAALREALARHELPFWRLVQALGEPGDRGARTLIEVALVYNDLPVVPDGRRLRWRRVEIDVERSRYALSVIATPRDGALELTVAHDPGVLDPDTVTALFDTMLALLELQAERRDESVRRSNFDPEDLRAGFLAVLTNS